MKSAAGPTKITILCENTAAGPQGITGEHGFSALIETDRATVLFDTGQGMSLGRNARTLGVDLTAIDTIVFSHGHYDHTGGLADVLHPARSVEVIAHPDVLAPKYAVDRSSTSAEGGKPYRRFIGMKHRREYLEETLGARFTWLREPTEIRPGILFSGEVPRATDFEKPDTRLMVERGGKLEPDPLLDDASLLIESSSGPVVLLGCAHAGAVNVLRHFSQQTGHTSFHALIGGTHLGYVADSGERLEKTFDAFESFGLELIGVSHCTGQAAAAACRQRFGDRFAFANAGWSRAF
jgi:7,8-dihydropterin-6-yl-methyl-4-(beta-D-ribofuranosyl)aminobenzene 5'-phosphate synthase